MPHRILIVDDDDSVRAALARILARDGHDVVTATDVPAGMHVLETSPPDLLITDVRMDTYNGLHLIAMARQPVPAIVVTGFADRGIEADARRLGAEYLVKPVTVATLREVISRALARAEEQRG